MANNEQLIADLGEAINRSNASQVRFGANNDSFNRTINAGLAQINATIRDIDGLLGQILDKINELKARIAELQGNGGPGNAQEIALLKQQLLDAQNGQVAATEVMNRALVTLRSNTEAMDGSIAKQDEPAMTAQLKTVNDSLLAMQVRLQGILNDNPPEGGPIVGPGMNQLDGGSRRRRRTNKKRRKTRRTHKKRKQTGGYGYKTKQHKAHDDSSNTSSSLGRGRGIYKKSKKRRSTRS
jgi:hypothetical protein